MAEDNKVGSKDPEAHCLGAVETGGKRRRKQKRDEGGRGEVKR